MKTNRSYARVVAAMSAIILISSFIIPSTATAQRRRMYIERRNPAVVTHPTRTYYPVYVGGHRYFYSNGYFYSSGRSGYATVPAPLGARIRVLPYGFLSFNIGRVPYYYYGGVYYEFIPDQNVYVVVQKPSGVTSTATATDNEDKAVLTDGTTMSGVFRGATEDSVQFEVNGQLKSVPVTKITSIDFAPSDFDTTAHK